MDSLTIGTVPISESSDHKSWLAEVGIDFVVELGFKSVQVERDSLTIIKKVNLATQDKSMLSPIIKDIKGKMGDLKESPFSLLVDEPTLLRMPWLLKGDGCTSYDTR
ncbi:hypothetical protein Gohar_004146 [Gossypium harknessii]|uniref:RNase H type-1 domain-containing protein n=1 Tax=Gossypium harknessii TaxID=34285 RepID=A0A7J9H446_9ROSI|nr:hypothetical protein [Gossypium harknessii]